LDSEISQDGLEKFLKFNEYKKIRGRCENVIGLVNLLNLPNEILEASMDLKKHQLSKYECKGTTLTSNKALNEVFDKLAFLCEKSNEECKLKMKVIGRSILEIFLSPCDLTKFKEKGNICEKVTFDETELEVIHKKLKLMSSNNPEDYENVLGRLRISFENDFKVAMAQDLGNSRIDNVYWNDRYISNYIVAKLFNFDKSLLFENYFCLTAYIFGIAQIEAFNETSVTIIIGTNDQQKIVELATGNLPGAPFLIIFLI
jgi:hypothetical protein